MRSRRAIAAGFCLLPLAAAAAPTVTCRYTYGGETRVLQAAPVASPYGVAAVAVGSYFKFRVVFQDTPPGLAAIKVYTYADRDEGAAIIHQATYAYPPARASGAPYGFTGLNAVYEPLRDGELQYWCDLEDDGR